MLIGGDDRVRMERAHVRAWPALRTACIDGWLWRSSGGGSQRANSVSAIDFHGASAEAAIADAAARYAAVGEPARFHTFEETSPYGLAGALKERGYGRGESTATMFKRIEQHDGVSGVEVRDHAWAEWREVYLGVINQNRQGVNRLILDRIPDPRGFFGYRLGGETVAVALCVASFGCAVIECVATRGDARRAGAARAVLAAVEAWAAAQSADWLGLQVAAGNFGAVALYERLGFVAGATNCFWVLGYSGS